MPMRPSTPVGQSGKRHDKGLEKKNIVVRPGSLSAENRFSRVHIIYLADATLTSELPMMTIRRVQGLRKNFLVRTPSAVKALRR